MIQLGNTYRDYAHIAQEWYEMVETYFNRTDRYRQMILMLWGDTKLGVPNVDKVIGMSVLMDFRKHLAEYVLANEEDLGEIAESYKEQIKGHEALNNLLYTIFAKLYENFRAYNANRLEKPIKQGKEKVAYHFFKRLNIRTCPYCNRQYTFTISSTTTNTSPEYDHFYDKSEYPILAVSFYNLVPSCHTCNHLKGTQKITVNPYFHRMEGRFAVVDPKEEKNEKTDVMMLKKGDWKLDWLPDSEEAQNVKVFGLRELYAQHDDYVDEIISKTQAYNKCARELLADGFQNSGYTENDVSNFVWGPYMDVAKHGKRPLSKLTFDLLRQFGVI